MWPGLQDLGSMLHKQILAPFWTHCMVQAPLPITALWKRNISTDSQATSCHRSKMWNECHKWTSPSPPSLLLSLLSENVYRVRIVVLVSFQLLLKYRGYKEPWRDGGPWGHQQTEMSIWIFILSTEWRLCAMSFKTKVAPLLHNSQGSVIYFSLP